MLPILMYNNMDGSSNSLNNTSLNNIFDDSIIINSVRSRKKVTELPSCPVCSCTIRQGELESHLSLELYRLQKLSNCGTKRKLSGNSSNMVVPGTSSSTDNQDDQEIDVTGCPGSDVYQRVHSNRLRRLRTRRRSTPPPTQGECPLCNATLPMSKLQKHALRCLKRSGATVDEILSDTTSEDESIDVENDEPAESGFGAEYQWCGEWRVRATALQEREGRPATSVRRVSSDQALVVDADEDTELYGPPQYSPSRIAPDEEETNEQTDEQANSAEENKQDTNKQTVGGKGINLVEASAETRIQALKERIKDLEKKQNAASEAKCLICLGPHTSATVSIQCWHVYCEVCWLQSLKLKKICPQCNAITTTQHLRRIYM